MRMAEIPESEMAIAILHSEQAGLCHAHRTIGHTVVIAVGTDCDLRAAIKTALSRCRAGDNRPLQLLITDRVLDMMRTATNVFGDSCSAVVIARSEDECLNL